MEEYLLIKVELEILPVVILREELRQERFAEHEMQLNLGEEEINSWEA